MEELVKRLRSCSYSDPNGCDACSDCPNRANYYECKQKLALQAADAIEALICEVATEHNARLDAEERQRWIPVTERLIYSGWYLAACNEWGGSAVRKAIYDEATRKWLEFPCGGPKDITKFVTHYMPLPQPPKEG